MNPRQLEVFHAIMVSPSLTEAARTLHVSQPAVSTILKHMERQLGVRLLERIGGRMVPTPEAEMLFPEVERLFAQLQSVRRIVREVREGNSAFLSLVGNPSLANVLFPRALARLRKTHPSVRVRLDTAFARQVVDGIARRDFDLGLIYGQFTGSEVKSEVIGSTSIVCAMHSDNPLAAQEKLSPRDLVGQKIVTLAKGTLIRNKIEEAFLSVDCELSLLAEVTFSLTACFIAMEGDGIALVDPLVIRTGAFPNLVVRPFSPDLSIEIVALYPKNTPRSRLGGDMRSLLVEILKEEKLGKA